jgi:hypothetical protein
MSGLAEPWAAKPVALQTSLRTRRRVYIESPHGSCETVLGAIWQNSAQRLSGRGAEGMAGLDE